MTPMINNQQDKRSRTRIILYWLIALAPVVLLLLATECYLRNETQSWYQKKLARNHALKKSLQIHRYSPDPELGYELTPGASVVRDGISYQINSSGFRDDEFGNSNPGLGTRRIVVIGDSVAWGWSVPMDKAWPQQLEMRMNQAGSHPGVVYNMAVNGYATGQEVRILEKYGLAMKPDLVILNYVLNDPEVEDGGLLAYFESTHRIETWYRFKFLASYIYAAIKTRLGVSAPPPNNDSMDHFFLTHETLFGNVEKGFDKLGAITTTANGKIPVLVIVTPVFDFKKNSMYPWHDIHMKVGKLAASHGFNFLDLQPYFSAYDSADVSFDPIHPNAVGHEIISKAIDNWLKQNESILQVRKG